MKNRPLLVILALALIIGAVWYFRSGGGSPTAIVLVDQFPQAEKRSTLPVEQAFSVQDVTIAGEGRKSIFMHPNSRMTFKNITLPRDAWLRAWVALSPEVWERKEGDGVLFRFGVSDGRTYDDLVRQHVDPQNNPDDRRWIPLEVDLSSYGGVTVDLIFNTESALPGRADNPANDWALWGAPEVYLQR